MGNLLSQVGSLPGVKLSPGADEDRLSEQFCSPIRLDPADVAMLFLQFSHPSPDRESKSKSLVLPADLIFLVFKFVGEGFLTQTQTVDRRDVRAGSENEARLDLCAFLAKNGRLGLRLESLSSKNQNPIRVKEVAIRCRSHDQGWSSYPDQKGQRTSSSWADCCVAVLREGEDRASALSQLDKSNKCHQVYRNLHASRHWEDSVKVFSQGSVLIDALETAVDELQRSRGAATALRAIEPGAEANAATNASRSGASGVREAGVNIPPPQPNSMAPISDITVQLWSRSCYPGWRNHLEFSSIEIVYELRSYDHWLASDCRSHIRARCRSNSLR